MKNRACKIVINKILYISCEAENSSFMFIIKALLRHFAPFSDGSGGVWNIWEEFTGVCKRVTVPGRKPWGRLAGDVSCGRPPSPPPSVPSLPASCCMASSSPPAALEHLRVSHACPLLLEPEKRKQFRSQSAKKK